VAFNQPGLPQFAESAPYRDPRRSKPLYEGGFTRKLLARLISTAEDIILDALEDVLIFGKLQSGI
jgi:hypothetical protein